MLSLALCGPVAEGFGVFVPLEKGDHRGSEASWRPPAAEGAASPLPRGTKELHLSPNVQAPDHWLAPLVWTGLWFVTTLTAFVLDSTWCVAQGPEFSKVEPNPVDSL